jgi:hypothetical protein
VAKERVPQFSGEDDDFCIWFVRAKAHATWFGYVAAMNIRAENDLPAAEGPRVGAAQEAAVERNMKAAAFLTLAMPDSLVINVMAAGLADVNWRNQPMAHLMVAYLKDSFKATMTMSRVGAKRDLENCTMKKDDNPKALFERLTAIQFKYAGNPQTRISEDELVAQAVQALLTLYSSTVVGVYEAERRRGRVVTMSALQIAVCNHYAIAMRAKTGTRAKDIDGGFAAMEIQAAKQDQANVERIIQDKINKAMREMNINGGQNNPSQGGAGHGMGDGVSQGVGQGLMQNNAGRFRQDASATGQHNMGYAQEIMMAMAGNRDQSQIETQMVICYNCGQYGH